MASTEELQSVPHSRDQVSRGFNAHDVLSKHETQHPAALAEALRAVRHAPDTPSDSNSDSGYDARDKPLQSVLLRHREVDSYDNSASDTPEILPLDHPELDQKSSSEELHQSLSTPEFHSARGKKTYVVASDDAELREILRRGLERVSYHRMYDSR